MIRIKSTSTALLLVLTICPSAFAEPLGLPAPHFRVEQRTKRSRGTFPFQTPQTGKFKLAIHSQQWVERRADERGMPILAPKEPTPKIAIKGRFVVFRSLHPYRGDATFVDQRAFEFPKNVAAKLGKAGMAGVANFILQRSPEGRMITPEEAYGLASLNTAITMATAHHLRKDQLDLEQVLNGAIRGAVEQLPDRFSHYLDPATTTIHKYVWTGGKVGVGISIASIPEKQVKSWRKGQRPPDPGPPYTFHIAEVIAGGPARKAGVKKGDIIRAVDGRKPTYTEELASQLAGQDNSKVKLTLERDGKPLDIEITRHLYDPDPITKRLHDGLGYLRLNAFDQDSFKKVRDGTLALDKKNGGPLKGLVLDLRGNSGGDVDNAMDIANLFLVNGTLIRAHVHGGRPNGRYRANPSDAYLASLPTVVLVDERSASSSELVAGILQDTKRAVVIGRETVGKGTALAVIPLPNGGQLALTSMYNSLPAGRIPHDQGIIPDISWAQARDNHLARGGKKRADYVVEEAFHLLKNGKVPAKPEVPEYVPDARLDPSVPDLPR